MAPSIHPFPCRCRFGTAAIGERAAALVNDEHVSGVTLAEWIIYPGGAMPEFGVEEPIEDAIEQRTPVGDDPDSPALDDEPEWEASEADVADQRLEVQDEEPRG
jgi:hypothetical protein